MQATPLWILGLGLALAQTLMTRDVHAHGAHQHGVAQLMVAVEGTTLSIRLESPLDNLLGFERAPRNPAERAAATALLSRLRAGEGLFVPMQGAGCRLTAASVAAPVLEGAQAADGHAELTGEWRYTCTSPDKLTGLRVRLLHDYPRLKRLDAVVVSPRGQRAAWLTARMSDLTW